MARTLKNILSGKAPMPPSELSDLVKSSQVPKVGGRVRGIECERLEIELQRLRRYPGQELAVVARAVGAEVRQDGGERSGGEREGEKVIE